MIYKSNAPKFPDDTVAIATESIVDLYGKITTHIIICRTFLILRRWFIYWQDLWTRGGHYILILRTWQLRGHLAAGKGKMTKKRGERDGMARVAFGRLSQL
jgi:hypothetical protein